MIDVNVTGTANVLAAARRENVGRVVFTSTAGVFAPTPRDRPVTESAPVQTALPDPYVTSKVQAHQLAVAEMHAGLPLTIVLPAAGFAEANARRAGRTPVLSRVALDFARVDIVVDASKARRDLGWTPAPLEDRIRETMAWYIDTYRVRGAPMPVKPDVASG